MGYSSAQAKDFITHIAPIICEEARKREYKIRSTTIAQAIIEGAAGTSVLARKYHNHFGMKCGSSWKGASVNLATKEEYQPGQLTNIRANWRVYPDDKAGIAGYYDFIQMSRYQNLKTAANYQQFAQFLKADGWATSSTYVNTLISTVRKYNLQRFDDCGIVSIAQQVIEGKWGTGEERKKRLEGAGYNYAEVQAEVNRILKGE